MRKYILIGILFLLPSDLFAHPHAFVDSIVTFQFNDSSLQGLWVKWTFDKLFSAEAILEFDLNKDGVFNKQEEANITRGALTLKLFGYFTYITYRNKTRMVKEVKHFKADIKNHRLIYRFFIPLNLPKRNGKNKIAIAIYDKVFYADFGYSDPKPVRFSGTGYDKCRYTLKRSKLKISYNNSDTSGGRPGIKYTGTAHPQVIILNF
ncbi:MAG: DUF1007 family protein [Spirochaetales bacterium]|nr:DUF1007 family protein [Spirochaetales bacterium]